MTRKQMVLCAVILVYISISICADEVFANRVMSERLIADIDFSSWIPQTFEVSPDGKRIAYATKVGDKQRVIVDGKEGEQYDSILTGTPIFSPDSKQVAYGAQVGNKWLVIVNGEAGKQYDGILEGTLIFSADSQRVAYIAVVGDITPLYQASATIVASGELINTVRRKVGSRSYMRDVADKAGVAKYLRSIGEPAGVEDVVKYLRGIVEVRPRGNETFEIFVMHQSPEMAKKIADTLVNTYLERTLRWRQNMVAESLRFITEELNVFKKRLIEAEKALLAVQEKDLLDSPGGKDSDLVNSIRQLSKLKTNLVEVELDLREANSELQNAKTLATGNVTEDSYSVVSHKVKVLEEKQKELNEKINKYSRKLQQLPQRQLEHTRLQLEKQAAEDTYSMLLNRLDELSLLRSLELQNMGHVAGILDPARLPDKPVKLGNRPYLSETFTIKGIYLVEEAIK